MKRVFLGPVEVAGYYAGLEAGLVELGYRVLRVDLEADKRRYRIGKQPMAARLILAVRRYEATIASGITRRCLGPIQSLLRWVLLMRIAFSCEAFVYGFAATVTWYPRLELRLLRLLRKRIVFVYHGSDGRPPFLDGQIMASARRLSTAECAELTRMQKAKVALLDSFADVVVDNPMSAHFHERPCVNWHAIGVPSVVSFDQEVAPTHALKERVRILHSPSHPESKGTPAIRQAISRLRSRGLPIDYVEIVGQPHATVMAELTLCDFVVDQVYSDVPMAGFATEAAALGRAAVVGGLAGEAFRSTMQPASTPPTLYCHPDELEDAIANLVLDAEFRRRLGEDARSFVLKERSPKQVAERFARLCDNRIPAEWMFDPKAIRYAMGAGPPWINQSSIRRLVQDYGISALELDDKPELRDAILAFGLGDAVCQEPREESALNKGGAIAPQLR